MLRLLMTSLLLVFVVACSKQIEEEPKKAVPENATINGEVSYRERIALPPDAVLELSLEDVSEQDVASITISSATRILSGAPPFAFDLEYDPRLIKEKASYTLRARILSEGRIIFTTEQLHDPFAAGTHLLELVSVKNSRALPDAGMRDAANAPIATFANTYWRLISVAGEQVRMQDGQEREAFLKFALDESKATGFSGCNQFNGAYDKNADSLSIGPLAMTKKMCVVGMETEQAFMMALEQTKYFSIEGYELTFFDNRKLPLAKFVAVYF